MQYLQIPTVQGLPFMFKRNDNMHPAELIAIRLLASNHVLAIAHRLVEATHQIISTHVFHFFHMSMPGT
jgi:hypothetical protein